MDLSIAAELVRRATALAVEARRGLPAEAIVQKSDGSVVTAVDVALQVYLLDALERAYGPIPTIAEEDLSSIGGKPAAEAHCAALLRAWGFDGGEDRARWALSSGALDGSTRALDRVWVLDPIDGTQGFVDGAHWCPCLALLACGEVVFGANGHPTIARDRFGGGVSIAAERGAGTWMRSIDAVAPEAVRAAVPSTPPAPGTAVRVVASARSTPSQDRFRMSVGEATGHRATLVHSDSQAKYGLIIAGDADIAYSRRGAGPGKYVWDHAGAVLLAREAGAWVGDTDGGDIDLSQGRRLSANRAVRCAAHGLGPAVAATLAARDREEGFVSADGAEARASHEVNKPSCAG